MGSRTSFPPPGSIRTEGRSGIEGSAEPGELLTMGHQGQGIRQGWGIRQGQAERWTIRHSNRGVRGIRGHRREIPALGTGRGSTIDKLTHRQHRDEGFALRPTRFDEEGLPMSPVAPSDHTQDEVHDGARNQEHDRD